MRAHRRSKGHLLTPAVKEVRRTRAEHLLQWLAENGHENVLFTDEKIYTIEEQYNNQNNKFYAQTSLEVRSEGERRPSPFLRHGLVGGVSSNGDTSSFLRERGETGAWVYLQDLLEGAVKPLNMTLFSGQEWVFQQDSASAHKAKTNQEWLRRNLLTFISAENWPSGSPNPTPWTVNCGVFWRIWLAESVTATWIAWRDPSRRQRQRSPWRQCVRWQQRGRSVSRLASRQRTDILSDIIMNVNLRQLQINYLPRKVDVLFSFPSRSHCTCYRT